MPLATLMLVTIDGADVTFAHGLTHAGASRTPHWIKVHPGVGTNTLASFNYAITFDSRSFSLGRGIETNHVAQVFVKRSHTIEDISNAF